MVRARIYVGSRTFTPEFGLVQTFDSENNRGGIKITRPGLQEIWEYYQLFIDGKLIGRNHYIPYPEEVCRWYEVGYPIAMDLVRNQLTLNDCQIVNGKIFDLESKQIKDEVEIEPEKIAALRQSIKKHLEDFQIGEK